MSDEIVVFNDVNPYTGMRGLLVKRAGGPVDLGKWMEIVPESMRGRAIWDQFEMEQGLFTWHHLRMDWETREFIRFEGSDSRLAAIEGWKPNVNVKDSTDIPAVAWQLERGDRLSGAIHSAAELYWGAISRYPKLALVRTLPQSAPETMSVGDGAQIRILCQAWVWRNTVIVL